jgi:hypothetical protein
MVKFSDDLYWVSCTLAGGARRGYEPRGVNLRTAEPKFPQVTKAVYFVVDGAGYVAYVGKVCRAGDVRAIESRLKEHVGEAVKASTWARLYVVPLQSSTANVVVEYVEGLVGERLEPYQNKRLPNCARLAPVAAAHLVEPSAGLNRT